MKIVQLTAENVKRLKAVDITPVDSMVEISGKNDSGKTSVLDSIWWALAGEKNIQRTPIRSGTEQATIRLDLGEIIVKRTFTPKGTKVIVLNPVGAPPGTPDKKLPDWGSPQEMLNDLMGKLSFDPLAFTRMDPKAQLNELRKISELTVDIDALDAANAADFKRRTDVNRDAKQKRAQADAFTIPANLPAEPVDESELLNQIEAAAEHNASIETRKARREQAERDAADKVAESERLRKEAAAVRERGLARIAELEREIARHKSDTESSAANLESQSVVATEASDALRRKLAEAGELPAPIAVADLRAKLDAAKATNAAISKRSQRDKILTEAKDYEAQSKALKDAMAAREKEKADAIMAAKMPIEGLGFGDGFITYRGLPFDQSSDAQQLQVSVAIAMAKNPKLRVIRIRDGSLLDENARRMLADFAREKDFQIWCELVDTSGKIGIVMEDGEVVADNQVKQEEEVTA